MNLTSEKKTKSSPLQWWITALAFLILIAVPVFESYLSHGTVLFMMGVFATLLIIVIIICRTKTICRECKAKVEWDEVTVAHDDVEEMIKKYNLRKPALFNMYFRGKGEWSFSVLKCKKCNYQQVIRMGPYDAGG